MNEEKLKLLMISWECSCTLMILQVTKVSQTAFTSGAKERLNVKKEV